MVLLLTRLLVKRRLSHRGNACGDDAIADDGVEETAGYDATPVGAAVVDLVAGRVR